MKIFGKMVHCLTRHDIPKEGDNITEVIDLEKIRNHTHSVSYYLRSTEECPFARGNWILDICLKNGDVMCFKYPKEMTEDAFLKYLSPLVSIMSGHKK